MRFLYPRAGLLLLSAATGPAQESGGAAGSDPLTSIHKRGADHAKGDLKSLTS